MGKQNLSFANIEIGKKKSYYSYKSPIFLKDVDIEKELVSISTSLATCVMIIVSRHIMIPKASVSIKPYDGNTK